MQRNESTGGRDSDESRQMVLRKVLGSQIINSTPETEAMMIKKMQARLAWNAKYIDMLEDLICHYQREVNFWKGRE
jgi:hypothetical protein